MVVRRRRRRTATKKKRNIPTNKKLYARVKSAARRKFAVYPSAYANAWLVREYKKRGGGYRRGQKKKTYEEAHQETTGNSSQACQSSHKETYGIYEKRNA